MIDGKLEMRIRQLLGTGDLCPLSSTEAEAFLAIEDLMKRPRKLVAIEQRRLGMLPDGHPSLAVLARLGAAEPPGQAAARLSRSSAAPSIRLDAPEMWAAASRAADTMCSAAVA